MSQTFEGPGTLLGKERSLHKTSSPENRTESKTERGIKPKEPRKEHKMSEEEKELNRKILKNMNRKLNFLKNPRFRSSVKCLLYSNSLFKDILSTENPFVVEPIIVT